MTQKSNQKKSIRQLADASLEKLALSWLKPSKLAPASLKQDSFRRQLHWFFGSPDEVARLRDSVFSTGRFTDNHKKELAYSG